MAEYTFEIPGEMRGKQRAKVTTRGGFGRAYTPQQTVNAEAWVKACAVQAGVQVLEGPLSLSLTVFKGVPESWSKKRRAAALANIERPTGKPDLDNIAKLIADSLNGIAWKDDSQVVTMTLEKFYGERPHARLTVMQL